MWRRLMDQVILCWAPKAVCPTIKMEWLGDSWMISMKLPLSKAVGEADTQSTPGMGYGPSPWGTYACQVYTPKGCGVANPSMTEHTM